MDVSHTLTPRIEGIKATLLGPTASNVSKGNVLDIPGQTGGSGMNANRTVIGADTAKRVFRLHWMDMEKGEIISLKLPCAKFLERFANRVPCVIGMEACGGSRHCPGATA